VARVTLFKDRLLREHPELFTLIPTKVWQRHWNVDSRAAGGRRLAPSAGLTVTAAQSAANAIAWKQKVGALRVPKGVYRFRSHEEADEWLWQMLTRPPR